MVVNLRGELETKVETLWSDMYNGGKDGVKTKLTQLIASLDTERAMQNQRDKFRDRRTNIIIAILGLIITILGAIHEIPPAVDALKKLDKGDVHIPKIFHSQQTQQEYTVDMKKPPADAGMEPPSEINLVQ